MALAAGKRIAMVLYSGPKDPRSHWVRMVSAVKGTLVDIINVNPEDMPEELMTLNPYQTVPTLVDRDLVLYATQPIIEYFDERYPHPPLLPGYPVARAECRLMLYRIERDWYSLIPYIESGDEEQQQVARKHLRDSLISIDPIFANRKFFMGDECTLVDTMLAPLLWRLPYFGISLPAQAINLKRYMKRLFAIEAFQVSLSEIEREFENMDKSASN